MSEDTLVKVEGVSKKFCRSLKRSLWYGVQDVASEMAGHRGGREELRKNEFWAVKDVSFELQRGECLGLIGPNGAGKSTLLKILNGLVKPDTGRVTMEGRVGALIELGAGFNPILTARENIFVNGSVLGFNRNEIERQFDEIVEYSGIGDFIDAPVQNLSSGMKVRLGFSVAIQLKPDIMLIDEVLAVGDLSFRLKCINSLVRRKQEGLAIILVSHNLIDVMRLADLGLVLKNAETQYFGNIDRASATYNAITAENLSYLSRGTQCNFTSIRMYRNGRESSDFSTGDRIEVIAKIQSKTAIHNARVNFHIDTAGVRLNSTSSVERNFYLNLSAGETRLKLVLDDIPLLQGGYILNLDLYGPKTEDFVDHSLPIRFMITEPKSDYFGFGVCHFIRIKHTWHLLD